MVRKKTKNKILICDPLDEAGLAILREGKSFTLSTAFRASNPELKQAIRDAVGVVVRSGTRLTADILKEAKALKIIGRAGVGIDNVDVKAASKKGVVVVNTPGGNTISAAEHTMSLMLCMARNLAPAHQSMSEGLWDRKSFTGVELFEKTLGLVGLGRIGAEVAKRAQSFGMKVVAYDPFLRAEKAREAGVSVTTLNDLFRQSDFVSLHVPLTEETRSMINANVIRKMKKGARLINCARGGLLDEAAVLKGLQSKKIAGLAVDVYEKEPPDKSKLLDHPNVLKTPHLGASTEEAQIKVSVDIARTIVDYLTGQGIRNAVNMPTVDPETLREMEPYCSLAEKVGALQSQIAEGQFLKVEIRYVGHVAKYPSTPLTQSVLKGLLSRILAQDVNLINAEVLAKERGIKVNVTKAPEAAGFANLIQVTLKTAKERRSVAGTLYSRNDPRIVMVDDLRLESVAQGHLLMIENKDVPGMVGQVGTLLGKNKINIADMSVGRNKAKKRARIFINVDAPVSDRVLKQLRRTKNILDAKFIRF